MAHRNTSGWNPARKNKKIGTPDQGFKNRNAFDIPCSVNDCRPFWKRFHDPVIIPQSIGDHEFAVVVEPTLEHFKHYVSIDDLLTVIAHVPESFRGDIGAFVLRQPKRKERIFEPVWGRLSYYAEFGPYTGAAVILESQPLDYRYKTKKRTSTAYEKELNMLQREGHVLTRDKRHNIITSSPESRRNTQLYRTILHEIGHNIHHDREVCTPSIGLPFAEFERLDAIYDAKPRREKEDFANRYAEAARAELADAGVIPFDPIPVDANKYPDVDPNWFYPFGHDEE